MSNLALRVGAPMRGFIAAFPARQRYGALAALLIFAGFAQALWILNCDAAWFLTMDQKWLQGFQPYTQLFEVDPPLSPALYMPALLLSDATGWSVAILLTAMGLALASGSALLATRIMRPLFETDALLYRFAVSLLFLFIVFPLNVFGQRDWFAVVCLTPFVAVQAARFQDVQPGRLAAILAGVGAGVAMAIKPHYALPAGAPLLLNALTRKSLRPLFTLEFWVASFVVAAYGAIVVLLFPSYLTINLPKLALVFAALARPSDARGWLLLFDLALLLPALAFLRLAAGRRAVAFTAPWLAAALGGVALFLVIAKWWSYTGYAMMLFALTPLIVSLTKAGDARGSGWSWAAIAISATVAFICMTWLYVSPQFQYVPAAVASIAPAHPKVITITDDIALGHPLVRDLHGDWVGTSAAQAMAAGAIKLEQTTRPGPAMRAKLDAVIRSDRERLLADIERQPPDIILADSRLFGVTPFDWWGWAEQDPKLAKALANYHYVGAIRHRIEVWKRNGAGGAESLRYDPKDVISRSP